MVGIDTGYISGIAYRFSFFIINTKQNSFPLKFPGFKYDFTTYDGTNNRIVNSNSIGTWDLQYSNSYADTSQDRFQVYVDPNFGMQYAGQRSFHDHTGTQFINHPDFFYHMWFYTCSTDSFVLFTIQERDGPSDVTDSDFNFLSIGVQGDGYIYIEMRLVDNEVVVALKEKTTTLQVRAGWNYIAIDVSHIYEFSYVNMYHRSEYTTASPYYSKYYTFFRGFYSESEDDEVSKDVVVVFGCKDYITYDTAIPDESVYGLCMRGWIQYAELWTSSSSVWTSSTARETAITGYIDCTGTHRFCNNRFGTVKYLDNTFAITATQMLIFDSSTATLASNIVKSPASSYYTCNIDLSTDTKTYKPFYQPSIGRITTNETNYFKCTLSRVTATSWISFFPAMFTMEAWFRLDPIDLRPDGYISQVFALYDNTAKDYRLGFGISNTFLRIYIDDTIHDLHYLFNETTDYWHYVAVSYTRLFERETRIQVFLDNISVLTTRIFDWYIFQPDQTHEIHIANNFPGIVRKTKMNARPYCLNDKSLWINVDSTKCVKKGATGCTFCDTDETGVTAGTYNCFYNCYDFGYYISGTSCTECHDGCRYCKSAATSSDCYLCNQTSLFHKDYTKTATTDVATIKNADRITCICSLGTITMGGGDLCMKCDERCAVCTDILNLNCDMCADGAYKVYKGKCEYKCPENYEKDDENRICNYDKTKLLKPELPQDPQGCIDGYYWDWAKMNCTQCYSLCRTCEFKSPLCTSCPIGRYLTTEQNCEKCESFWNNAMMVGTNGMCVETCGDGYRFSLTGCDDGNTKDGDGCSSQCIPEDGYQCFGGDPNKKDTCLYIPTELVGAYVNEFNDVILNFSRPINLTSGTLTIKDLRLFIRDSTGNFKDIDYKVKLFNLPSNYLYLYTIFKDDVIGGAYYDQIMRIEYQNTKTIIDINKKEVKKSTYARVWLYTYKFFPEIERSDAELYGKLSLGFVFSAIAFWMTIAEFTKKSVLPAVFVLLAFQQIFYIGCQDLYLDQKTSYFFSFFRIFRLEHTKLQNYFIQNNWIEVSYYFKRIFNNNFYFLGEVEMLGFLLNNSIKIYSLYIYFFFMPLVLIIDFIFTQCISQKRLLWFNKYIAKQYFFSGPLLMTFIFCYPMSVTTFLEIRTMTTKNEYQMYSLVVSFFIAFMLFLVWLCSWLVVVLHYKYRGHSLLIDKYSFLYKNVKNYSFLLQICIPFLITRRLASSIILAVLVKYTLGPLVIQAFLCAAVIVYLLVFRSFKQTITNAIVIGTELLIGILNFECLLFSDYGSDKSMIAWIAIGTIFGGILMINVTFIILGWFKISAFFYMMRFGIKKPPLHKMRMNKVAIGALQYQFTTSQNDVSQNVFSSDNTKNDGSIQGTFADSYERIDQDAQLDTLESVNGGNYLDQSGHPLFKVNEIQNLKQKELDRYKEQEIKTKKNLRDGEEKLDKEINDHTKHKQDQFDQLEEKRIQVINKKKRPLKKKPKSLNALNSLNDEEFKTPGKTIEDITIKNELEDDDQIRNKNQMGIIIEEPIEQLDTFNNQSRRGKKQLQKEVQFL